MAAAMGYDGYLKVGEDKIAYVDNWSASITCASVEVPELGKRYKNRELTIRDFTGSFSGTLDLADTAQKALYNSYLKSGTVGKAELHLGMSATQEFTGTAVITSFDITVAHADKITFSCSFEADGEFELKTITTA